MHIDRLEEENNEAFLKIENFLDNAFGEYLVSEVSKTILFSKRKPSLIEEDDDFLICDQKFVCKDFQVRHFEKFTIQRW